MPNSLTRHVGFNAGPWLLETLVKHYFDQLFTEKKTELKPGAGGNANLRREELLYDEAFHLVKSFLEVATHHTVEEIQRFSNARTPSSPFTHVVRLHVPMSCCDEAAEHLIVALGGEEVAKRVVGGTKWWQVRGVRGVDAQWIVARKDYQQAKKNRRHSVKHERGKSEKGINVNGVTDDAQGAEETYRPEMDEMRCILYLHGGGYYFGSVDQERYLLQRYARKFGGRILAINYRLAPQYPFPCALQDALAAYLYLIQPPEGALHKPIHPSHIVVSGDSAGGGLSLALLQVIRDSGLPNPAGGILISPWCDLTHSFPSIHLNTETDVNPKYGLCLHKPSPLWPPPNEQLTFIMQSTIRSRIKQWARLYRSGRQPTEEKSRRNKRRCDCLWGCSLCCGSPPLDSPSSPALTLAESAQTGDVRASAVFESERRSGRGSIDVGATAEPPGPETGSDNVITVVTPEGERLKVTEQVQLYAPNNLLGHPLVSPVVSYLGGLPPLLIIAGDAEVLRDEIIHTAHRAAHPEKYIVKESTKEMYPALKDIEKRHGPTQVHLQVYDETAHVLPVLFPFTTPAKYCFRAMAIFAKFVTGLPLPVKAKDESIDSGPHPPMAIQMFLRRASSLMGSSRAPSANHRHSIVLQSGSKTVVEEPERIADPPERAINSESRPSSPASSSHTGEPVTSPTSAAFSDAQSSKSMRYAGDPVVYENVTLRSPQLFPDNMIRERISIHGEVRPLEPEEELEACKIDPQHVGVVAELAVRRYLEGRRRWDEMFAHTIKHIEKKRRKNLEIAQNEARVRNIQQLQAFLFENAEDEAEHAHGLGVTHENQHERRKSVKEGLGRSAAWTWAWAIDGVERPPASSIVSRRDTKEARRLAIIADQPMTENEEGFSGNNLWSFLVNALSADKKHRDQKHEAHGEQRHSAEEGTGGAGGSTSLQSLRKKLFSSTFSRHTRTRSIEPEMRER